MRRHSIAETLADRAAAKDSRSGPRGIVSSRRHPLPGFLLFSAVAVACFAAGVALDALLRPSAGVSLAMAAAAFVGYVVLGRRALIALAPELDRRWRKDSRAARIVAGALLLSLPAAHARARQPPADQAPPAGQPAPPPAAATDLGRATFGGYVEAFYSYNFNTPSNRITNYRGFDNRESTFTLSNLDLNALWEKGAVSGKLSLQVGHTPNTYYLGEPALPGTSATSSSDGTDWKYVQEAWVGYKAGSVLFKGGLFLSPIGVEGIAVKDNWNWSRSNLFFGLPFYHTGVSATSDLSKQWTMTLMICNGWNSVVDNNKDKSVDLEATFKPSGTVTVHGLYFGGVERPTDAPEGSPWRNLFDLYATWDATPTLSFILSGDAGWENNDFGTSSWQAAAGYVRVKVSGKVSIAARADVFREHVPSNTLGSASAIFWPADRVASQTLTLDYHPRDQISVRLEGRHDGATGDMYFKDRGSGDGSAANPSVPNAKSQTTVTLGVTT
ncbi:MAG TPA: outer membrane beta-barrel protein, partial [Thermoanaerobaculia bacterium]|nr:outer membrane beta-barrel protein [Thermoanaerobaculia bacterium]